MNIIIYDYIQNIYMNDVRKIYYHIKYGVVYQSYCKVNHKLFVKCG